MKEGVFLYSGENAYHRTLNSFEVLVRGSTYVNMKNMLSFEPLVLPCWWLFEEHCALGASWLLFVAESPARKSHG